MIESVTVACFQVLKLACIYDKSLSFLTDGAILVKTTQPCFDWLKIDLGCGSQLRE